MTNYPGPSFGGHKEPSQPVNGMWHSVATIPMIPPPDKDERRQYALLQAAATIVAGAPHEGLTVKGAVERAQAMLEFIEADAREALTEEYGKNPCAE
jgi:hypothetical protein